MSVAIRTGNLYMQGGAIFVTSIGTKCCVVNTNTTGSQILGDVAAYKNIDTTPVLLGSVQDGVNDIMGGLGTVPYVAACIDSNDVIHVICMGGRDNDIDTAYATLSDPDGSPTWSSWEEVLHYTDPPGSTIRGCSITVDSNDKPHVLLQDMDKYHGTNYGQSTYLDKTGASWSTPENISDVQDEGYKWQNITIKASDDAEAFSSNYTADNPIYTTRTSGTWGSESAYSRSDQRVSCPTGVQVTTGGTVYRYHSTFGTGPFNIYENDVDTGYDAYNSELNGGVSARLIGTTRYILYVDANQDVHLISNDGGGWVDEGVLETGTYERVMLSWQYLNDNAPADKIIYLFQNTYGTTIYYGEFSLGGPTLQTLTGSLSPVGITSNQASIFPAGSTNNTGAILKTISNYPIASIFIVGILLAQYFKTLTLLGSINFENFLYKQIALNHTGSTNDTATLYKQTDKFLVSGLSLTATAKQQISKIFSGSIDFASSLTNKLVVILSLVGSIDFVGVVQKQANKLITSATDMTGAINNSIATSVSGSIQAAGSLLNQIQKTAFGNIDFSGTVSNQVNKTFSGAVTSVGILYNIVQKLISGSILKTGFLDPEYLAGVIKRTFTGALDFAGDAQKTVQSTIAGSLDFVSALNSIIVYVLTAVGSIDFAGALTRQTNKLLSGALDFTGAIYDRINNAIAGSLTATGTLLKETQKTIASSIDFESVIDTILAKVITLVGSLDFAGDLTKTTNKLLSGAADFTGTVYRRTENTIAGAIIATGSVLKQIQKILVGSLDFTGALSNLLAKIITVVGSLDLTGNILQQTNTTLNGALDNVGALYRTTLKQIVASILATGYSFSEKTTGLILRTFTGALDFVGSVQKTAQSTYIGSANFASALEKLIKTTYNGAISSTGVLGNLLVRILSIAGSLDFSGAISKIANISLIGSIEYISSELKETLQTISGSIAGASSIEKIVQVAYNGAIVSTGVLETLFTRILSIVGSLDFSSAISKIVNINLSGSVDYIGSGLKEIQQAISGSITGTGNTLKTVVISMASSVSATGALIASYIVAGAVKATALFKGMFRGMFKGMK